MQYKHIFKHAESDKSFINLNKAQIDIVFIASISIRNAKFITHANHSPENTNTKISYS